MTLLTYSQFCALPAETLLDLAEQWIRISDKDSKPLFEVKRGSLFIFGNQNLPRMAWGKFRGMPIDDKLLFLASGVCVLTCENEDAFLVRLAEDNDDAPV